MKTVETERLSLRWIETTDAPFILQLLNDPSWLKNIGDRGVYTLDDARDYIENSPRAMYKAHGFGLFLVTLKEGGIPMGMCGLIKRDGLEDVDLGFAFMPAFHRKGYAYEAAYASLTYGKEIHNLSRIVAITLPSNTSSIKLLKKLGFQLESKLTLPHDTEELALYAIEE